VDGLEERERERDGRDSLPRVPEAKKRLQNKRKIYGATRELVPPGQSGSHDTALRCGSSSIPDEGHYYSRVLTVKVSRNKAFAIDGLMAKGYRYLLSDSIEAAGLKFLSINRNN